MSSDGKGDRLWVLLFALLGLLLGCAALLVNGRLYFYQFFMPEPAYFACGKGFFHPGAMPSALLDFLSYKTDSLDCSLIAAEGAGGPPGLFARGHLYLAWLVAGLWRLFSPSYLALLPLVGLLYAAYAAGGYVLVRLFFSRRMAIAGALLLVLSASALSMSLYLRDFAKAPFFIWSLVFLIAAIRATTTRALLMWGAAAGVTIGIGYGFRSDVAIMLPVGVILLLIGGSSLPGGLARSGASVLLVGLLVLSGAPVLFSGGGAGAGFGAMMMEGASDPFNVYLDLGEVPYSWGERYSDELTLSAIAADLGGASAAWVAGEGAPIYGVTQSLTRSTEYMLGRVDLFVGDLAARALKAAGWILAYPSLLVTERTALDPGGIPVTMGVARVVAPIYDLLGRLWIIPIGILGAAVFMLKQTAERPREALALLMGFGLLLGYTALQFSMRHVFHLEFMWVLGLLSLIWAVANWRLLRSSATKPFLAGAVTVTLVLGALHWSLAAYQAKSLTLEIGHLLAAPAEQLDVEPQVEGAVARFSIAVPPDRQAIVNGAPDSMIGGSLPTSVSWQAVAAADRLLITIGGENCSVTSVPVSLEYDTRRAWQPFDTTHDIRVEPNREPTYLVVPAFYRATQNFAALTVPSTMAGCVRSIARVNAESRLPASFVLVLPPDWPTMTLSLPLS